MDVSGRHEVDNESKGLAYLILTSSAQEQVDMLCVRTQKQLAGKERTNETLSCFPQLGFALSWHYIDAVFIASQPQLLDVS